MKMERKSQKWYGDLSKDGLGFLMTKRLVTGPPKYLKSKKSGSLRQKANHFFQFQYIKTGVFPMTALIRVA